MGDMLSEILYAQQQKPEITLVLIWLFGWIPLKKEDMKILINFFKILKESTFISLNGMNTTMKMWLGRF